MLENLDLKKILKTFKKQLGLFNINMIIRFLNTYRFNDKIKEVNSYEEGAKTLLEIAKNKNDRVLVLYCVITRLENMAGLDIHRINIYISKGDHHLDSNTIKRPANIDKMIADEYTFLHWISS